MEEEKTTTEEETPEVEEENSIEESSEEQEPSEKPVKDTFIDELEEKNKRLYARLKKAEEKVKKMEVDATKEVSVKVDPDDVAKIMATYEGLDPAERKALKKYANLNESSLEEAKSDEDFQLWQKAHREKVEKEKTPKPSTKKGSSEQNKALNDMSLKEKEEYFRKAGWVKEYRKPGNRD